jgi:hypothetical protein
MPTQFSKIFERRAGSGWAGEPDKRSCSRCPSLNPEYAFLLADRYLVSRFEA